MWSRASLSFRVGSGSRGQTRSRTEGGLCRCLVLVASQRQRQRRVPAKDERYGSVNSTGAGWEMQHFSCARVEDRRRAKIRGGWGKEEKSERARTVGGVAKDAPWTDKDSFPSDVNDDCPSVLLARRCCSA
jgi:hypothetical protein